MTKMPVTEKKKPLRAENEVETKKLLIEPLPMVGQTYGSIYFYYIINVQTKNGKHKCRMKNF